MERIHGLGGDLMDDDFMNGLLHAHRRGGLYQFLEKKIRYLVAIKEVANFKR